MKIKTKNPDLFLLVGNIFPTPSDLQSCFNFLPERTRVLLGNISKGNLGEANESIDISFFFNVLPKINKKRTSSFIDNLLLFYNLTLKEDYYVLSNDAYSVIDRLIDAKYYNKWKKLWDTYKLKYDAIKPYQMEIVDSLEEESSNDKSSHNTSESSSSNTASDKIINDETTNSVYGFNSNNAVPSDKSKNISESENSSSDSSNSSNSSTSEQDVKSSSERNVSRLGNIGNITQQELIEKEREVWRYQIIDEIIYDISKILSCGSY